MLPSLLARDIQTGLMRFLVSGFEPADALLHGIMSRFVDDESAWLKGIYLPMGLPFTTGESAAKTNVQAGAGNRSGSELGLYVRGRAAARIAALMRAIGPVSGRIV